MVLGSNPEITYKFYTRYYKQHIIYSLYKVLNYLLNKLYTTVQNLVSVQFLCFWCKFPMQIKAVYLIRQTEKVIF